MFWSIGFVSVPLAKVIYTSVTIALMQWDWDFRNKFLQSWTTYPETSVVFLLSYWKRTFCMLQTHDRWWCWTDLSAVLFCLSMKNPPTPTTVAPLRTCLQEECDKIQLQGFIVRYPQFQNALLNHYSVITVFTACLYLDCDRLLKYRNWCILPNKMTFAEKKTKTKTKHELPWVNAVCKEIKAKINVTTVVYSPPTFTDLGLLK